MYCFFSIIEVDLIPVNLDSNVSFTTGADGFPAFRFSLKSNVQMPAGQLMRRLSRDFSILVLVQLHHTVGGFLFAIVNPSNSIIQFGLELSESESVPDVPSTDITLYYTDYRSARSSVPLVVFTVPEMAGKWEIVGIRVQDDDVALYLNCSLHKEIKLTRKRIPELSFEDGSTFYTAQRGLANSRKFEVGQITYEHHFSF